MPGGSLTMRCCGAPEGSQGHWHASDPSRDHRRAEETRFPDGPGKAHRADRDRPVAVRRPQTGRSGSGRSGRHGAVECLLDDVVVGKQEMVGAIDAVCDVAQRIIGKLKDGAAAGGILCLVLQSVTAPRRIRQRLR